MQKFFVTIGRKKRLRHWLCWKKKSLLTIRHAHGASREIRDSCCVSVLHQRRRQVGWSRGQTPPKQRNEHVLDVDISPGEVFAGWTMEQVSRCDAVVIFCGEELTSSQSREIEVAQRAKVRVIPIVFPGRSYKPPENLKRLKALQKRIEIRGGGQSDCAPH